MTFRKGITACIITLNEEHKIEKCLNSLHFADEIILVDSGSSDRTCEIAESKGAKVIFREFDNFIYQKNYALSLAQTEWVLSVDADEVVSSRLASEILTVLKNRNESDIVSYRIPRLTWYLGRWIKYGGWYPDYNVRLFRKSGAEFIGGTVHEKIRINGPRGTLNGCLYHYSYDSIQEHVNVLNQYSTMLAADKFKRGDWSSPLYAIIKSFGKFLVMYIWKLGFLDGRAGFVIAALGAFYNYLKYIKLWELRKNFAPAPSDDLIHEPVRKTEAVR